MISLKGDMPVPATSSSRKSHTEGESEKSEKKKIVALNFRVPAEFKKNFKIAAATHGITQSDLLQQAFEEWRKKHS
jgi:hypothetical protein